MKSIRDFIIEKKDNSSEKIKVGPWKKKSATYETIFKWYFGVDSLSEVDSTNLVETDFAYSVSPAINPETNKEYTDEEVWKFILDNADKKVTFKYRETPWDWECEIPFIGDIMMLINVIDEPFTGDVKR